MTSPPRTPLWRSIADTLRREIFEGRYGQGDKLPTEAQMATRFAVNRHTVRHAISALVEEGIVHTRRGSGAFVTARPTDYRIGKRVRFHENLAAEGQMPGKTLLHIELRIASDGEAAALDIKPGAAVCAARGLSTADGAPIAYFESVFPMARLPGIEAALEEVSSVTQALRRVGVSDYTRASTRLTAVAADAIHANHLHLRPGDPVLRSTSVNVDPKGVPVEYGRTIFAGDRVTLTLDT